MAGIERLEGCPDARLVLARSAGGRVVVALRESLASSAGRRHSELSGVEQSRGVSARGT